MSQNNKKNIENTLTAIGIATLVSGVAYSFYCYWKNNQAYENNWSDTEKRKRGEVCPICLNICRDKWLTSPCKHGFHKKCIIRWFETNNSCPICRKSLRAPSSDM